MINLENHAGRALPAVTTPEAIPTQDDEAKRESLRATARDVFWPAPNPSHPIIDTGPERRYIVEERQG